MNPFDPNYRGQIAEQLTSADKRTRKVFGKPQSKKSKAQHAALFPKREILPPKG